MPFAIIVVIVILVLLFQFAKFLLVNHLPWVILAAALIVAAIVLQRREAAKERARQAAANAERHRLLDIENRKRRFQQMREAMQRADGAALKSIDEASRAVATARRSMDLAAHEFDEKAYSPFWEAIENTALAIRDFESRLRAVESHAASYQAQLADYRKEGFTEAPPVFAASKNALTPVAAAPDIVGRLSEYVRKGQRDISFAQILEMRKTQDLLRQGFGTLAEGLDGMRSDVTRSLGDTERKINDLHSRIDEFLKRRRDKDGD